MCEFARKCNYLCYASNEFFKEARMSMKKTLSIIAVSVLALGGIYFSGVGYYAEKFSANTVFATVDVSNLTLDQAEAKVIEDLNDKEFVIREAGEEVARITVGDLSPEYHTGSQLKASYASQDPSTWVTSIFDGQEYDGGLANNVDLDEKVLAQELETQGITNEDREAPIDAVIDYNEADGYHVIEGEKGTEVDPKLLEEQIANGLEEGTYEVDLEEAYAYPEITSESEVITDIMDKIDAAKSIKITYEIADDLVTVPQDLIESWIYFDQNNEIIVDNEAVSDFLTELNDEYSTFGKTRTFTSTYQGKVQVPPGILGWAIDIEEEAAQLSADLNAGKDIKRQPIFYSTGGIAGAKDDIGDTHVEIDLTYQHMFLYVDGDLVVDTPIVSGQIGAETVPGANAVNEMLSNTNLVGYNQFAKVEYSTPVSYWIRFDDQAQGIHDASWQGSFGGNVYQYAGSLGCINTPYSAVSTIYEYVNIGTPVVVFY